GAGGEEEGEEERGGGGGDDDRDSRGNREQASEEVPGAEGDTRGQHDPEALEDEQRPDERREAPNAPVDAPDEDARDDQHQPVEQQGRPVSSELLGGVASQLVAEVVERGWREEHPDPPGRGREGKATLSVREPATPVRVLS